MAKRSNAKSRKTVSPARVADEGDPLLFPGTTRAERRRITSLVAAGTITSIGPRLYAQKDLEDVAGIVRSSWAQIVSRLFPDALISHRTALEYQPSRKGEVFLTGQTNRTVMYPGLQLRFLRGPRPLADDPRFIGVRASSLPRALLENLSVARGPNKSVDRADLEHRLEQILRDGGTAALNAIRDRARAVADTLGWDREAAKLDSLIGALMGTRTATSLTSGPARARAGGSPYDERCVQRLQLLFAELRGRVLVDQPDERGFADHFRNKAFLEAYFSNYIEGTTFELREAEQIVFEHQIPPRRPRDAHDITSTFQIVSDPNEMRRVPRTWPELRALVLARHALLMAARPEAAPGQFKETINRAGDTQFVHPDYVQGTLQRGFELLVDLPAGLPRAIFVMFLIADVHPFNDGNGRIARIMMNAELVASRSSTIIVPTVFRDEYVETLRALTRQHRPTPVVDMLVKAQRFSTLDFSDYPAVVRTIDQHNWFKEPGPFRLVF